jgi:hypothetical protein
VLREAVRRANRSSLTYAYALFDLGRTLRLDGDPAAAIPILERRLQIPNQPQLVAYELELARRQAGQQTAEAGAEADSGNPSGDTAAPPASRTPRRAGAGHHGRAPGRAPTEQTNLAMLG